MAQTVAKALISAFAATGTRRLFGLPGGGSSLDLIEASREAGLSFVLTRHECSAVMMAAATAELDGSLGVALMTKGPGTANGTNGVAHASLDRNAVAVITDGFSPAHQAYVSHQWFDQQALYAPLVKAHSLLSPATSNELDSLVNMAMAPRQGPVHLELTGVAARAEITADQSDTDEWSEPPGVEQADETALTNASRLLRDSSKPVIVCGLETRDAATTEAVRDLARKLGCPALVTYKAKGVVPDDDDVFVGIFTGGAAEKPAVAEADLIILIGVDPVELILQPWPYETTSLELSLTQHPKHYLVPTVSVFGELSKSVSALGREAMTSAWSTKRIGALRKQIQSSLRYKKVEHGLSPEAVVTIAAKACTKLDLWPRVTVDAGAHMFSATAFWPCARPNDLLISNGLASMGFALPAGIAAALHEPDRTVIAFTGDGGLLMCAGELATAVEQKVKLIVVVFNDGALSLIDIKQQSRELPPEGVRWAHHDFAKVMTGFGGLGLRTRTAAGYRAALRKALNHDGPSLIDVEVDPTGYPEQLRALRG
ncbi:MAG: thiamine pyrophosphate-binding protein [Burkholderiaceae bacterium]